MEDWNARKFCGRSCFGEGVRGAGNHNYKGGVKRGHDWGYLRYSDDRYVHRAVMEKALGRKLETHEHVHHRDGNVLNNDISNLELMSNSEHRALHAKTQRRDNGSFA